MLSFLYHYYIFLFLVIFLSLQNIHIHVHTHDTKTIKFTTNNYSMFALSFQFCSFICLLSHLTCINVFRILGKKKATIFFCHQHKKVRNKNKRREEIVFHCSDWWMEREMRCSLGNVALGKTLKHGKIIVFKSCFYFQVIKFKLFLFDSSFSSSFL